MVSGWDPDTKKERMEGGGSKLDNYVQIQINRMRLVINVKHWFISCDKCMMVIQDVPIETLSVGYIVTLY